MSHDIQADEGGLQLRRQRQVMRQPRSSLVFQGWLGWNATGL